MNEKFITEALRNRHPENEWVFVSQLRTQTGSMNTINGTMSATRIIDAFALNLWPSKNYKRIAYEIKCTRRDFLSDLRNPIKYAPAYFLANEFWFVVPQYLEIGDILKEYFKHDKREIGIMTVDEGGKAKAKHFYTANEKEAYPLPLSIYASMMRNIRNHANAREVRE